MSLLPKLESRQWRVPDGLFDEHIHVYSHLGHAQFYISDGTLGEYFNTVQVENVPTSGSREALFRKSRQENLYSVCFVAVYRSVEERDKSLSIGVTEALLSLFAFLPSPIIYGMILGEL